MNKLNTSGDTILRLRDVQKRTGVSRSSIYVWKEDGRFPQSLQVSVGRIGFLESEVDDWIDSRPKSSGKKH